MDFIRGVPPPDDDPVCPVHREPMELYKKLGKPTRYQDQQTASYTMIYRCVVAGCGESAERTRVRNQIPAPGEITDRPHWAERDRKAL
jgi:hypothetical protein